MKKTLLLIIVIIAVAASATYIIVHATDRTIDRIAALLTGIFGTRVEEHGPFVVVTGRNPVSTYSVVRQVEWTEDWYETTWLLSTKWLKLWAAYNCDIGIDLNKGVEVKVSGKDILVKYPRPRVLSTEITNFWMWSDDGLWNGVSDAERVAKLKELQQQALAVASEPKSVDDAAKQFEERVRDLLHTIDPTFSVSFAQSSVNSSVK